MNKLAKWRYKRKGNSHLTLWLFFLVLTLYFGIIVTGVLKWLAIGFAYGTIHHFYYWRNFERK